MSKNELLHVGTLAAKLRLDCIRRVKTLAYELGSPQTKSDKIDRALEELQINIMNLINVKAEKESMELQMKDHPNG